MQSKISVTPDNPYSEVHIPRARLRSADDVSTVIANPAAVRAADGNPYGAAGSAPPPPYMVKEDPGEAEGGRCRACCYRCRRKR
uniref:Uncharacterized protein n=1 Tax=Salarias fasciatus TaxID=181472 RepID=A0A672HXU8_SALFA